MIKSLRKRHFQVWLVMMIWLPAGIVFAWLAVPNREPVRWLPEGREAVLPVVRNIYDMPSFSASVLTNDQQTSWQLEWNNKKTLMVPSAVIYRMNAHDSSLAKAQLIGRIEARGRYWFPLDSVDPAKGNLHLVLYDFIHQQILEHINIRL